jgi:hypothetical protein
MAAQSRPGSEAIPRSPRTDRRCRGGLAARSVLLTGLVSYAFIVGLTHATFSGDDQNTANQFSAGYWAPRYVRLVGVSSCASGTNDVVTVAAPVAAGDTLIVRMTTRDGNTSNPTAFDSRGNAYQRDAYADANKIDYALFSARVTTALAAGDTITVTHAGNTKGSFVRVDEFAGIAADNRVYSTNAMTGTGTSSSISASAPSGYGIAVAGIGFKDAASSSEPAGWTILNNETTSCNRALTSVAGYRLTSPAVTVTFSSLWSGSRNYATAIVVYRGE